jgi:hypothetical protein
MEVFTKNFDFFFFSRIESFLADPLNIFLNINWIFTYLKFPKKKTFSVVFLLHKTGRKIVYKHFSTMIFGTKPVFSQESKIKVKTLSTKNLLWIKFVSFSVWKKKQKLLKAYFKIFQSIKQLSDEEYVHIASKNQNR